MRLLWDDWWPACRTGPSGHRPDTPFPRVIIDLPNSGGFGEWSHCRGGCAEYGGLTRWLAQRAAENSPARQCWVGIGGGPSPVRDDRNIAPTLLSSLTGVSGSPAANPALKCWAVFSRPCGTAPTRADRCKQSRCTPSTQSELSQSSQPCTTAPSLARIFHTRFVAQASEPAVSRVS